VSRSSVIRKRSSEINTSATRKDQQLIQTSVNQRYAFLTVPLTRAETVAHKMQFDSTPALPQRQKSKKQDSLSQGRAVGTAARSRGPHEGAVTAFGCWRTTTDRARLAPAVGREGVGGLALQHPGGRDLAVLERCVTGALEHEPVHVREHEPVLVVEQGLR
jgi:hypothetical protein